MKEDYFEKCLHCYTKWNACKCERCHHCGKSISKKTVGYPFCSMFCSEGNRLGVVNPNII